MTDLLKQTIKEETVLMPKEWRDIIDTFDWDTISKDIGKKYFLTEENIEDLQVEIGLVLIGEEEIGDLRVNIEYGLIIGGERARQIRDEIIEKIFAPMFNLFTENVKKSLPTRNIHWQQNLDFIISGGDYAAFTRRVEEPKNNIEIPKNNIGISKFDDLKSKFTI